MQDQTRLKKWGDLNRILALMSMLAVIVGVIVTINGASTATGWYSGMAAGAAYFILLPILLVLTFVSVFWFKVSNWQFKMELRGRTAAKFQTVIALLLAVYLAISSVFAYDSDYAWMMLVCFVPVWIYTLYGAWTSWPSVSWSIANLSIAALPCLLLIVWNAIRWKL